MTAIEYCEYEPAHAGDFHTEASLSRTGFDIRVERAIWPTSGMATVQSNQSCLIRMLLPSPAAHPTLAGNRGSFNGRFKPLGSMLFIPHGTEFHLQHEACEQKALICLFDTARLSTLAAFNWDWQGCVEDRMLDLNDGYLLAALSRLADEVATPGFASELHSECLLTGVALDLRKQFQGMPLHTEVLGKLSPRQLKLIEELLQARPEVSLSLLQLADHCELPVRKLPGLFKNTTGVTLRRYAAQARLKRAMGLLTEPGLLVKQVAYESGFRNAAAFTAAFRKALGSRRRSTGGSAPQHSFQPSI